MASRDSNPSTPFLSISNLITPPTTGVIFTGRMPSVHDSWDTYKKQCESLKEGIQESLQQFHTGFKNLHIASLSGSTSCYLFQHCPVAFTSYQLLCSYLNVPSPSKFYSFASDGSSCLFCIPDHQALRVESVFLSVSPLPSRVLVTECILNSLTCSHQGVTEKRSSPHAFQTLHLINASEDVSTHYLKSQGKIVSSICLTCSQEGLLTSNLGPSSLGVNLYPQDLSVGNSQIIRLIPLGQLNLGYVY